jgi:16S rRNA (guanine527-N7)-methyltransferase
MIETEADALEFVESRGDTASIERLRTLVAMLRDENEQQNLVSSGSLNHAWLRHIADSAQLLDLVDPQSTPWFDLGSGAGFPGLAIGAMRPGLGVVLVESRAKRIAWLRHAVDTLGLSNVAVVGRRLELVDAFPAAVITARAFAPLPRLIALARRFSTSDTLWLLPKGRSAAQEVAALPENLQRMFHVEPSRTDPEAGIVVGRLTGQGR